MEVQMNSFFYHSAKKAADASSMEDFCTALVKCRGMLDSRFINRTRYMEYLKNSLSEKSVFYDGKAANTACQDGLPGTVRVYRDAIACLVYAAFKIGYCTSVEELVGQLDDIISFLLYKTIKSKTDLLDTFEITLLLELLQKKFSFIDAVTYEKRLEIYLINRSHLCFDSYLLTFHNTYTGKWINKWMVMSFSPCLDTPLCGKYFVFLHEMGHILYNEITDSGKSVPELFMELTMVTGMHDSAQGDMLSEFFADLFAVTCMHNTPYASYNPYSGVFPKELDYLLEEYFRMLVSRIGTGYYGPGGEKKILH
jgi:hypothetical protein